MKACRGRPRPSSSGTEASQPEEATLSPLAVRRHCDPDGFPSDIMPTKQFCGKSEAQLVRATYCSVFQSGRMLGGGLLLAFTWVTVAYAGLCKPDMQNAVKVRLSIKKALGENAHASLTPAKGKQQFRAEVEQ
uniref:Uncharacterized protein n=1 Tax=Sphaerodactylus townsendi TaxID=933632 RepID=A0ACB8FI03_9SAUR